MNTWQNIDKIFIGHAKAIGTPQYGDITKEDIIDKDLPFIETNIFKPYGMGGELNTLISKEKIRWWNDGRMKRVMIYSVYPQNFIDGVPMLSPMVYQTFTSYQQRKELEEGGHLND